MFFNECEELVRVQELQADCLLLLIDVGVDVVPDLDRVRDLAFLDLDIERARFRVIFQSSWLPRPLSKNGDDESNPPFVGDLLLIDDTNNATRQVQR